MARVAFPLVLQSPSTGSAIVGATATITKHVAGGTPGTGPAATIFLSETGGSTAGTNQITTDANGRWTQGSGAGYAQYWLAQGTYDVQVGGTGLTTLTITRELASASQSDEVALAGEMKFWPGVLIPTAFYRADGTAVSRTGNPFLFAALTLSTTGTTSASSPTVTGVPSGAMTVLSSITSGNGSALSIPISGPTIAPGTKVIAYNPGASTLTLSQNASGAGTNAALVIAPHGVGDGSTTFNLPNMSQRFPLGQGASGTGDVLGVTGGAIDHTHALGTPSVTVTVPSLTVNSHAHGLSQAGGAQIGIGDTGSALSLAALPWNDSSVAVGPTFTYLRLNNSFAGYVATAGTAPSVPLIGVTDSNSATTQTAAAGGGVDSGQSTGAANPPYLACPWIIRHGNQ